MNGGDRGTVLVRVLGPVQALTASGQVIDVASASQRRLLGLLALHAPRRLRSEWLADVLGVSPGALRTTVSRVRAAIGSDVLATASTGYSLLCPVDAARFCEAATDAAASPDAADRLRMLGQALGAWTGPVLEEFAGEPWAEGEIARLTEIHAATVDDYADGLMAARRDADAVAVLDGQIRDYPYRDRSRGLLIRALAAAGRQVDALRAYRDYRDLLAEEVGTEPSPDVVRIERRVATGWDGREEEPAIAPVTGRAAIPLPDVLRREVDFVGRAAELATLASEANAAARGLRTVIIEGEPGIGKTSLLGAFATTLGPDTAVVYGRCDESIAPLEPFRTIVTSCVEHAGDGLLADHVAHCGGELLRLCPLLAERVPTAPAPTASDDAMERYLMFGAAGDLLMRIAAGGTLVMMLDDLQWAEPTALLLLRHLVRALEGAPILLVVSWRGPGDTATPDVRLALAELQRAVARDLPLAGLDAEALRELMTSGGRLEPDPEAFAALVDQTAGNALFASQLIRHWNEAGRTGTDALPRNLRDVVWSRVHRLGTDTSAILSEASVLGIEVQEEVLVEMSDLPERRVTVAIDAAVAAGLLIGLPSVRRSVRFVHPLVASTLYSELGPSRRARLHARAAGLLAKDVDAASPDPVAPETIVQLARHYSLAGLAPEALRWSVLAGDHAFEHLAPTEAAHHYRIGADVAAELGRPEAERASLLVRLGDAQHRAGDPAALATLEQGADLARRSGQRDALIRAALAANRGFMRFDSGAPGYLTIVEAAVAAADPSDSGTYARLLALLAESLMYTPNHQRRVALAHQALQLVATSDQPSLLAYVAPSALGALWEPGSGRLRGEVAAKALLAAEASGDPKLEFSARVAAYNVAIETGDPALAAHHLTNLRAVTRRIGEPRLRWILGICEVFEATMAARFAEAETLASANLDLGLQIGMPSAFDFFAGQFFVMGTFAGRHAELAAIMEQSVHDNPGLLPFKIAFGIVCAATEREAEARQILEEGMAAGFADLPLDNMWMTSVIGYSVLAIELGDVVAAAKLLPVIAPYAAEVAFNGATSQGPVGAYIGKLASLLGLHDLAEDHLLAALELATAFGWIYHRATTLFALAQARHRRLGALDLEGLAWLTEAERLCREGGFQSWMGQIAALSALAAADPPLERAPQPAPQPS